MSNTLTVVLPVHNQESTLRSDVTEVLEVAAELATALRLFIVDDGSTDDTYDTAVELAARYPQVRVLRHAERQGLGRALGSLRSQVAGDFVLVHDGVSRIDVSQIRQLWLEHQREGRTPSGRDATIDDLRRAAATHAIVEAAHARLAGFRRLALDASDTTPLSRRDAERKTGVGVIPPLPRPNFMGSLANFALSE